MNECSMFWIYSAVLAVLVWVWAALVSPPLDFVRVIVFAVASLLAIGLMFLATMTSEP